MYLPLCALHYNTPIKQHPFLKSPLYRSLNRVIALFISRWKTRKLAWLHHSTFHMGKACNQQQRRFCCYRFAGLSDDTISWDWNSSNLDLESHKKILTYIRTVFKLHAARVSETPREEKYATLNGFQDVQWGARSHSLTWSDNQMRGINSYPLPR